jgi:two-component system NtrC family sensor kinase
MRALEETQTQLVRSEKMTALSRLVAAIAHEINNPLQAIQGSLTLSREQLQADSLTAADRSGASRAQMARYLGMAEAESERIAAIMRRLRHFGRPTVRYWQAVDVYPVLEDALQLSAEQLRDSHVTAERQWARELPPIVANPDLLRQVFLDLVFNAIDAMPEGGVLRITAAVDDLQADSGRRQPAVRIAFNDTGTGMSPETLEHLFEPFFTTRQPKLGLGLYITYGIITSLDGEIGVDSQQGVGTTITMLLPALDGDTPKFQQCQNMV